MKILPMGLTSGRQAIGTSNVVPKDSALKQDERQNEVNAVDENRTEAIEAKVAHQEQLLAELSEVLYGQQKQIDQLTASLGKLAVEYRELLERSRSTQSPGDELPPHY